MAQRSIRFGVSDGKELRAATWKLWTETAGGNSEIYLACRSLGGELKASLHQSGKWHIAFSHNTYHEKIKGHVPSLKNRFTEKWPRPAEIAGGITLAFRIVIPYFSVCGSRLSGNFKKVKWVPKAPELKATEIDILITKPTPKNTGWPGKRSMGTSLISV